MAYALKEMLATKRHGVDIWFRCNTAIGPCSTDKLGERALFRSKEDAMQTDAFVHAWSSFEPVEVDETGNYNWGSKR